MPDQLLCQRLLVCLLLANTHTYVIARKVGFQKMKKSEKSCCQPGTVERHVREIVSPERVKPLIVRRMLGVYKSTRRLLFSKQAPGMWAWPGIRTIFPVAVWHRPGVCIPWFDRGGGSGVQSIWQGPFLWSSQIVRRAWWFRSAGQASFS